MNVMRQADRSPASQARSWLDAFNAALATGPDALRPLFRPDAHWRDLVALTGSLRTTSGPAIIPALAAADLRDVALDPDRMPPRRTEVAGEAVVEAMIRFDTAAGRGTGVVRLDPDRPQAWTLLTALDHLRGRDVETLRQQREDPPFERDFQGPNWLDKRHQAARFEECDPAVLIVGAGHAGLTAAAWLKALGVETLVVDRMRRLGDNWRLRYHGLKLHNQVHSNHLPFLPFPATWPNYIPKDKIANWLELYAEALELDVWTETGFEGAVWDGGWTATLTRPGGDTRTIRPRHIIMATSVSGTPRIPELPMLERFGGTVLHSSRFRGGADWAGRGVVVMGVGTSGHDIAQELHGHGARVTMVQRSPSLVVNVEPSAQLYDGVYAGEGPSLADRDLLNASTPLEVMKAAHRRITAKVRGLDAPLYAGLEAAGFRLDLPADDTGWPLRYRTRGGGYYFNVGCSDLIAKGEIAIRQHADIADFDADGMVMRDCSRVRAALVVLATGYEGQEHMVRRLFGDAVADRVGPVWGFDADTQELRNMWTPTPQPGLWFTAGSFAQCRIYSKYLALQIQARECGISLA